MKCELNKHEKIHMYFDNLNLVGCNGINLIFNLKERRKIKESVLRIMSFVDKDNTTLETSIYDDRLEEKVDGKFKTTKRYEKIVGMEEIWKFICEEFG